MLQLLFDFMQEVINFLFNILFTPIFEFLRLIFPVLDTLFNNLTYVFNSYVWDLFFFIPAFLKSSLHIPNEIFIILADFLTLVITYWSILKAVIIFKNIYGYLHGNFSSDSEERL